MLQDNPDQEREPVALPKVHPFEDPWVEAEGNIEFLINFNELLDLKAKVFSLNETIIENLIDELDKNIPIKDEGYWLTVARINELALVCSGNYADNCEFSLVGDLLFNPRLILVHLPGLNQTITKKRHTPLSEQFQEVAGNLHGVRNWLKTETLVEIKTEALLPDLQKRLENSGHIDREYLDSVEQRKRHIAELTGFLASGWIDDNAALVAWLRNASPADQKLLEAKLCRFDFERFFEMGRLFREWAQNLLTSREILLINGFRSSGFEA
jgi:hypothetical protein